MVSVAVPFVRDAGVRDHVVIDVAALDLPHCLDFLAVLLGFVVLLTILMQAAVPFDIVLLRQGFLLRLAAVLQHLDEATMRLFPVLAFGMSLRPGIMRLAVSHRGFPL